MRESGISREITMEILHLYKRPLMLLDGCLVACPCVWGLECLLEESIWINIFFPPLKLDATNTINICLFKCNFNAFHELHSNMNKFWAVHTITSIQLPSAFNSTKSIQMPLPSQFHNIHSASIILITLLTMNYEPLRGKGIFHFAHKPKNIPS